MANNTLLAAVQVSSVSAKLQRGTGQGGRENGSEGHQGGSEGQSRPKKPPQQDFLERSGQDAHKTQAAKAIGAPRGLHKHHLQDFISSIDANNELESLAQDLGAPQQTTAHGPSET